MSKKHKPPKRALFPEIPEMDELVLGSRTKNGGRRSLRDKGIKNPSEEVSASRHIILPFLQGVGVMLMAGIIILVILNLIF